MAVEPLSAYGTAGGDILFGGQDDNLRVIFVAGGQEHSLAFDAAHFSWGQVGYHYYVLAEQFFGLVEAAEAGADSGVFRCRGLPGGG